LKDLGEPKMHGVIVDPSDSVNHFGQDPVIDSIRKAEDRLTNSTSFLRFLGQQALNAREDVPSDEEEGGTEEYHFVSLVLNLFNTYLYMVCMADHIVITSCIKYYILLLHKGWTDFLVYKYSFGIEGNVTVPREIAGR